MRFLPVNLDALLVELADLDETLALFDSLQNAPIAGVEEIVPAARTLLVQYRPSAVTAEALVDQIASRSLNGDGRQAGKVVEIPVHYNGEDLADVAAHLGISVDEVIRRHTGSEYSAAFCGFAPGFAYLSGGAGFEVPRRSTPRTRVPAGAVALAGGFSAVYPQASPGGWQILGVTPLRMWDLTRAEPALLKPGYRVRFKDAGPLPEGGLPPHAEAPDAPAPDTLHALGIRATGLQTLLQDLGRPGQAGQGVSTSGALDRGAVRAANRVVGNDPASACLEVLMGGLSFVADGPVVIAVTGALAPIEVTSSSGRRLKPCHYQPIQLEDGDQVTLGTPPAGLRSYVAVRGGFAVAPVLGSLSTDTLAQVGPKPLAIGDRLGVHTKIAGHAVALDETPAFDMPRADDVVTLDVVMGPRSDWFTPEALACLAEQTWRVTPQSNRVGIRLAGDTPLAREISGELPSEGTAVGAIQVPPSGQPVLFLADHPLTGGYPVIGAVASHHLDLAGQIPVNARIRFNPLGTFEELRPTPPDEATHTP
ncbi:urea amidolyase family protein [Pseudomonas matsuisoli]|uniref:Allophanate hydrolase n=1 Tax=Pseudomonas matsuisoli TaxID=1515666 RepID=A0A917PZG5_9PSED|nr:urea amidolyase family protein [Pseudomonas matsuisoli]GGK02008.1 allophanate hydrolase [Pseudomonas matsuisoli]